MQSLKRAYVSAIHNFGLPKLRKGASAAGFLKLVIPFAALAYLGYLLAGSDAAALLDEITAQRLAIASVVALLYVIALYMLAYAWAITLDALAGKPVEIDAAIRGYALSIFGKYLPGNVFHYAGRQIAAAHMGCGQKPAAQATAVEIVGQVLITGALLTILLPFAVQDLTWFGHLDSAVVGWWPLLLLGLFLAGALAHRLLRRRDITLWPVLGRRTLSRLALLHLGYAGLSVALAVWLAAAIMPLPNGSLTAIAFAYLLAWLIGFITPGAPGGLGVREAILVAVLQGSAELSDIIAFAALSRAAMMAGEGLFALSGYLRTVRVRPSATT